MQTAIVDAMLKGDWTVPPNTGFTDLIRRFDGDTP